ncbi:hypothetical protein ACWDBO_37315 [Streptomyces mirabilis]|uniref:hypothetical protein n=1 Tax=Streptomyces mirabilis TaxID=68239 RepID=UPI00331707B7
MTRLSTALAVLFGLAMVVAVSVGGQCINEARWLDAAAAYGVAGVLLAGMIRELGHTVPGDYTDDIDTPAPAKRLGRLRAAREARRVTRATTCGCQRYWDTVGAEHDEWCPQRFRSVA